MVNPLSVTIRVIGANVSFLPVDEFVEDAVRFCNLLLVMVVTWKVGWLKVKGDSVVTESCRAINSEVLMVVVLNVELPVFEIALQIDIRCRHKVAQKVIGDMVYLAVEAIVQDYIYAPKLILAPCG